MDTREGHFEIITASEDEIINEKQKIESKYPNHGAWFRVGEIIELHGSQFRIKAVKPTQIILKLLNAKG